MEFRKIEKSNYMECINLKISADQVNFVSDNAQSLVEASFEEGLNTLGIYNDDKMVGFILYDYDVSIPGWSLSRFMIDIKCQGKGYGTKSATEFMDYFQKETKSNTLYGSINIDNSATFKIFKKLGFKEVREITYTHSGVVYNEVLMEKIFK